MGVRFVLRLASPSGPRTRYATSLLALALLTAQTPPAAPTDSIRATTVKTIVALPPDTTRRPVLPNPTAVAGLPADAPDPVTRRLVFRISGAILLLSLSTLLLYNVRSR